MTLHLLHVPDDGERSFSDTLGKAGNVVGLALVLLLTPFWVVTIVLLVLMLTLFVGTLVLGIVLWRSAPGGDVPESGVDAAQAAGAGR